MYLAKIIIENFRGIEYLEIEFDPKINILIGENSSCKSAVIDAIRLLYNIGEPVREISVSKEDFYEKFIINNDIKKIEKAKNINITYEFRCLSDLQKGAFYEFMVIDPSNDNNDFAKIIISYEDKDDKYPHFSYNTGNIDGQKADYKTFELFQHYYLGALRDSTRDLLSTRGNILGQVIKRLVDRSDSKNEIENIIKEANNKLLERNEVTKTRENVNSNLEKIFKNNNENKIGLHIEQTKAEYIVNIIKPYLPHDKESLKDEGFHLRQNSLGFNNLIYVATVLGDINEQIADNKILHYALLIEEPEAHLHPQLQLSLYNFLKEASFTVNSQLFITTHSPTLTSRVPLENLILLDKKAFKLSNCFINRENEKIIEDTNKNVPLNNNDFITRRKKLERYIDVTKSQLFYAKSVLFVEGISEEILIPTFTKLEDYELEDFKIELVNVDGTSFYPFLYLFNSTFDHIQIPKKIAVLTDDDRFPQSKDKEYSFNKLIENDFLKLNELYNNIFNAQPTIRINNLNSVKNNMQNILISSAFKTFEYELSINNINDNRTKIKENLLFEFFENLFPDQTKIIIDYTKIFENDILNEEEKKKVAILLWKIFPSKAEFTQDFSLFLIENLKNAKSIFIVPPYIKYALNSLKNVV